MMPHPFLAGLLAPLILLMAGCGGAPGDVVATYKIRNGTTMVVEASTGGWGRIEEWGSGEKAPLENYTLIPPKGENLRVMLRKGRWIVAEWRDYHAWTQHGSAPPAVPDPPKARFVEDGDQKVGRWTGTAYRAAGQSCYAWSRFVVMRGPGLDVFGRVMRGSLIDGAEERRAPPCELQAIDLIGEGVLLWIDFPETTLEKLEFRKIDPARFKLPSKPLSRSELFTLLDAGRPRKGASTPVPTMRVP